MPLNGFPEHEDAFFSTLITAGSPFLATDPTTILSRYAEARNGTNVSLSFCATSCLARDDRSRGEKRMHRDRLNRNLCTRRSTTILGLSIRTIPIIPSIFASSSTVADAPIPSYRSPRSLMYFLVDKHRTREQRDPSPSMSNEIRGNSR